MKISHLICVVFLSLLAYLLMWPTPVEPVAWTPSAMPAASGVYAPNEQLKAVERLVEGAGQGPEAISFSANGDLLTGYLDGRVVRISPADNQLSEIVQTGGRPLGLTELADGSLIIADAKRGLLRWREKQLTVISTESNGVPFRFVDDVDHNRSLPEVYFSDASARFGFGHHLEDALEHGSTGRLLKHDLQTGLTTTLLDGLHFANGVAVGPDDAYVLVNETSEYRVVRYWLKGENAGTSEIFIEGLPGFPDNITFNGTDRFWLALFAPRDPLLDAMAGYPFIRKIVARLPEWMTPKPKRHAYVLGLDLNGKVVANFQYDHPDAYAPITSARQSGNTLFLGSLTATSVGRFALPQ